YPDEFFYLKIDDMMKDHWFFDAFDNLSSHGVSVLGLNDLKNFKYENCICFDNVRYEYIKSRPALNGISFSIVPSPRWIFIFI
ncbi:MAG: hypothetical protein GY714_27020, partial [Desulfobacterales bacterium]|nr:hypothetical protein [Desulfobacterales bacterium]